MRGKCIIIVGPSASGKTRLVGELIKKIPNSARLITTTTRERRPNEVDKEHYFFMTRAEFEQGIQRGDFFEYAEVYGHLYGLSKAVFNSFMEKYEYVFVTVDVQGARTLKAHVPDSLSIFIRPDSIDELEKRFRKTRAEMTEEEIKCRLDTAKHELSLASTFDAVVENVDGKFDDTVLGVMKVLGK